MKVNEEALETTINPERVEELLVNYGKLCTSKGVKYGIIATSIGAALGIMMVMLPEVVKNYKDSHQKSK